MNHSKLYRCLLTVLVLLAPTSLAAWAELDGTRTKLERAREDLRLSQATERRISSELEQLRASCDTPPEIIKDYETYAGRVQAMVEENQRMVREMEAAYARHVPSQRTSIPPTVGHPHDVEQGKLPDEGELDEVAALDRELNESLAAFDDMLLEEMDRIRQRSAAKMTDLAAEAAAAAKRLRERGVQVDTTGPEATGEGKEAPASDGEGTGQEQGTLDREAASIDKPPGKGQAETTGTGGKVKQRRIPSGQDDDIVARQLREAAEKETDPELKEKLWKEYEEYKRGSSS